ncbi:HNH endonuclease signature motif containing protein [Corynebacterium sp. TAE3-ERU30]|uniref:HNH endonuclease signature motif containing protein n=1 Tax=Corynebacterium sp. TAE3-ERU30 TaxID=2849496 RepID=UPI001C44460A|nr:HNH endonuclease signature motif containing protein [Corynebacterium sp. TAE3-ERU30]MBV7282402.1 HNH endonuclease [Corynebacterium sp. TAE3-ERU30]
MTTLQRARADLAAALEAAESVLTTASDAEIAEQWEEIVAMDALMGLKAHIDVLLAHRLANGLSSVVAGTGKSVRVLEEDFGWSRSRATTVSTQAHRLYGPMVDDATEEDDEVRARRAEAAELRTASEQLLRQALISAETRTVIETKLAKLKTDNALIRETLRNQLVTYATTHSYADVRAAAIERVRTLNARLGANPDRGRRKRFFRITRTDEDGTCSINAKLPAAAIADFKAQLDAELRKPRPHGDTRTFDQRSADAACTVMNRGDTSRSSAMVFSFSAKDFDRDDLIAAGYTLPTNTGINLTLDQIEELGANKYGFYVIHDPSTGMALRVGRMRRTATFAQRLALFASEGVCSHPGCSTPLSRSDIHHITAWEHGGTTDIENLTARCRTHHTDNDDTQRDPRRHHARRDPHTGIVGTARGTPHPSVNINNGYAASRAAGRRIRNQPWPPGCEPPAS